MCCVFAKLKNNFDPIRTPQELHHRRFFDPVLPVLVPSRRRPSLGLACGLSAHCVASVGKGAEAQRATFFSGTWPFLCLSSPFQPAGALFGRALCEIALEFSIMYYSECALSTCTWRV